MAVLNLKYCKEILAKNEDRIILSIGFMLVAILSFGAGKLSETYYPQTPIIFQDAPRSEATDATAEIARDAINNQAVSASAKAGGGQTQGKIIGNKNSMIYHVPGGAFYDKISARNRIYFNSEQEARNAGYRKSKQ